LKRNLKKLRSKVLEGFGMVEIIEMDDNYILDGCPIYTPFDPICQHDPRWPRYLGERTKEIRRKFFREVRERYGNCVLFAWDEEKIVGFLIFLPKLVARRLGLITLPDDTMAENTLVFVCMQLVEGYRKKGLGTKLVETLIDWARKKSWKRIEVHDLGKGVTDEEWRWGWALPKWERLGFEVTRKYNRGDSDLFSVELDIDNNA
jgi:GNAT superfamily N-acetyltransferase